MTNRIGKREASLAWGVKLVALIHLTKWRTCLSLSLPPFARYILNPVSPLFLSILLIERLIIECLCQPAFCLLAKSLSNCVKTLHGDCDVARQPPPSIPPPPTPLPDERLGHKVHQLTTTLGFFFSTVGLVRRERWISNWLVLDNWSILSWGSLYQRRWRCV
jgi:hypothetical protein